MKSKELLKLNKEELNKKLAELKNELMKDRASIASGTPPKSPGLMRERRRTIARILTIGGGKAR